jgi:signal transduction histidine kinase
MFKQDAGGRESTEINALLREVVGLFNSEATTRKLRVDMEFADLLPPICVNKIQVQQVVLNLMMNAAEAMPDTPGDRIIVLRTQRSADGCVQVAVRDTGTGIEEKDLARVFEPFFTKKGTGIGMGLSISRNIIEMHDGRLRAANNPDRGTTFFFDLPVAGESSQ